MRLLLIGFGTVGQGLAELIAMKGEQLIANHGCDLSVVGIADFQTGNVVQPEGVDLTAVLDTVRRDGNLASLPGQFDGDALAMIDTVEADMMVEMTFTDLKTGEPATSHIRAALQKGMHVTTTNKGPVALHASELAVLAQNQGVRFLYEGTVVSGTPLLNLIRETLPGCEIQSISGILNGTTNYILTMMEAGMTYAAALKQAQELGYAEAVPDADVLGYDALAKVTILANTVFKADCRPESIPCEGITGMTPQQIAEAGKKGKRYKLIGKVWRENGEVHASVGPQLVELSHPLAGIGGAINAVTIRTDVLGDVTIVGPGAGRAETGLSALVDIIKAGGTL